MPNADHQTILDIAEDDTPSVVLTKEKERLAFISSQFHADIPMEAAVKAELQADLALVESGIGPNIGWIDLKSGVDPKSSLIARFETIYRPILQEDNSGFGTTVSGLTDWTDDATYVPAGGTSTVSSSGTLQKFWLDALSKNALNHWEDGLEMDTLVRPRSAATCNSSGVSSSMPDWYMDTEAFEPSGSDVRNCSVGTNSARKLEVGKLYWTWHPFASFVAASNPQIDVQYQPSKWCLWNNLTFPYQCLALDAWCMCSRQDMPIEWLIQYNYNEAPGVEKSWVKN